MAGSTQIRLDEGQHVVQFYERDDDLIEVVAGYLSAALAGGDAVLVVATEPHREAFDAALTEAGVDSASMRASGRLVVLDAAATLSAFMRDGGPDAAEFDAVVGGAVRAVGASGRPVRAYGEMVALLWGAGNRDAAIELERLWNALGETFPLSLFCAYPRHMTLGSDAAEQLAEVCALHSDVLAVAPLPADGEASRGFAGSPDVLRHARRFVSEILDAWDAGSVAEDAVVVVTELAANAIRHAGSDVTISLSRAGSRVRLSVGDCSAVPPVRREPEPGAAGGRGLLLVEAIASRWGYDALGDGKLVWAELG